MAENDLEVRPGLIIPATELQEQSSTSSGPGGQHANRSQTRITLRWNLRQSPSVASWQRERLLERLGPRLTKAGEITVSVEDHRSQHMNRGLARARLAALLDAALERPRNRRKTRPSRAAKQRRLKAKKRTGEKKALRRRVREDGDR